MGEGRRRVYAFATVALCMVHLASNSPVNKHHRSGSEEHAWSEPRSQSGGRRRGEHQGQEGGYANRESARVASRAGRDRDGGTVSGDNWRGLCGRDEASEEDAAEDHVRKLKLYALLFIFICNVDHSYHLLLGFTLRVANFAAASVLLRSLRHCSNIG